MTTQRIIDSLNNKPENYILPFFWQHNEDDDTLIEEIHAIYNSGIKALCVESRDYQGFGTDCWWHTMSIILDECKKNGNEDMVYIFCSTSKITLPGSGVAALVTSVNNVKDMLSHTKWQTIGHDKINQLRHVRFFKNADGVIAHMDKHAELLRPKFELVEKVFEEELGGLGIGSWTMPRGGYFISFEAMDDCAKEIVKTAKEAGVVLTGAGATYPYGKDPKDSNIRIAPSYPSLDELEKAARLFTICVKLVSLRKLMA